MPNRIPAVKECDASKAKFINIVGSIKNNFMIYIYNPITKLIAQTINKIIING